MRADHENVNDDNYRQAGLEISCCSTKISNSNSEHKELSDYAANSYDDEYVSCDEITSRMTQWENNLIRYCFLLLSFHPLAIDLGCGTGRISEILAKRFTQVIGYDFSPAMIDCAKRKRELTHHYNIDYEILDISKHYEKIVDFPVVMAVGAFGFGSFVVDLCGFLRHIYLLMQPNALAYFSFYNAESLWAKSHSQRENEHGSALSADGKLCVTIKEKKFFINISLYEIDKIRNLVESFYNINLIMLSSLPDIPGNDHSGKYICLLFQKTHQSIAWLYNEKKLWQKFFLDGVTINQNASINNNPKKNPMIFSSNCFFKPIRQKNNNERENYAYQCTK